MCMRVVVMGCEECQRGWGLGCVLGVRKGVDVCIH